MTRIGKLFDDLKREGRKGLIAYLTAGDPSPARTPALVEALERGGADLIELGVPFSDPIADGPVIQRAGERALKRRHHGPQGARNRARNSRNVPKIPLLLFTYLNPVMRYGLERLAQDAAGAASTAACSPTPAWKRRTTMWTPCAQHGLDTVFLAAPTSTERRLQLVARVFDRLRLSGVAHRRNRRARFAVRRRRAAGRSHARRDRSAAGGGLRHLAPEHVAEMARAGGSRRGGQRHRRVIEKHAAARPGSATGILRPTAEAADSERMHDPEEARVHSTIPRRDRRPRPPPRRLLNERTASWKKSASVKRGSAAAHLRAQARGTGLRQHYRAQPGPLTPEAVRRIFERIIDEMRSHPDGCACEAHRGENKC